MKNYHTRVAITSPGEIIDASDRIITMGSCFAEELGCSLARSKFDVLVNPLGTLFNPLSIAKSIELALASGSMSDQGEMIVESDGLWHSMFHHGSFSNLDRSELIREVDLCNAAFAQSVTQVDHVVLTLGSAHVYRLRSSGQIVANCHKIPGSYFEKHLLSIGEIISALENTIAQLRKLNPKMTFFLTVSPVRYVRDGLPESMRSKAHLLTGVHEIVSQSEHCFYFPAYEIVVDELRDYRYYQEDMVHPTKSAVRYVLNQFMGAYFTERAREQMAQIEKLLKSLQHRPIHPESKGYKDFLLQLELTISSLQERFQDLDFASELQALKGLRKIEA